LLQAIPFALKWDALDLSLLSSTNEPLGRILVPGQYPLQQIHSGPKNVNLTLLGTRAPEFLHQVLMNSSFSTSLQVSGVMGNNRRVVSALFTIPSQTNNVVESEAFTSTFSLTDVALLGGNNVGFGRHLSLFGRLFCLKNMIQNDNQITTSGLTLGVSFTFDILPKLQGILWSLNLSSDATIEFGANGRK
jgi:hypothetical protein